VAQATDGTASAFGRAARGPSRRGAQRSRKTYGSPRVHAELRAKGVRVGKKRVERIMRENGLEARRKRRFRKTTDSKHPHPIAPSVVARNFKTAAPNRVWATDVTAIWTLEGWLYLAVMLDLYSRRVVAWAASAHNDTVLALDALRRDFERVVRRRVWCTTPITAAPTRARSTEPSLSDTASWQA
jgi:transposase InsO family protein